MLLSISRDQLLAAGLTQVESESLLQLARDMVDKCSDKSQAWDLLSKQLLSLKKYPFAVHKLFFSTLYPHEPTDLSASPAWTPDQTTITSANITQLLQQVAVRDVPSLHAWTVSHYREFWDHTIKKLNIQFIQPPSQIVDLEKGIENPAWLPDAKMNIIDSCFTAPQDTTALLCADNHLNIQKVSYAELNALSNRVANSLIASGFNPGDNIGIVMPMNIYAVAIYLGIIKMGGVVVSIADSFSSQEIYTRLQMTAAKAVFTQDMLYWAGKDLPLYQKVADATNLLAHHCQLFVIPFRDHLQVTLSECSTRWSDFLTDNTTFQSYPCDPMTACNILFSSGTTSEPKAIIWNHTTPIKAASDAFYHQNIKPQDVLAWPTNLGWMMGPWLIYAALINHATIALYPDAPKDVAFGAFVEKTGVTMLGVVPTLVATWRESKCMEHADWSKIKVFSSTGECSNPVDMLYLMSLAGYKPVIEYCGGTEIGGAYISSTVVEKNYPSLFTTPTLGMNFIMLSEDGKPAETGEVAIIPPSIGLSTSLLNADHHNVYYANMPSFNDTRLRRHGDQIKQFPNHTYCMLGRADDTMNLGGIKISATEIERAVAGIKGILETAAIAVTPTGNGPSQLIIFVVASESLDKALTKQQMQKRINQFLNPLFKITDIIFVDSLPKTASNKIMRRQLRALT